MLFREQLLGQFLTVLFHTLLDRSHALLTEDVVLTIYNMATVNFIAFFDTFLMNFLQNMDGLLQSQRDSLKHSIRKDTVRI